jgi:hypothetical protein
MERFREFPGEGLRRNDLLRWGIYLQTIQDMVNYNNNSTGIPAANLVRPNQSAIYTLAAGSKMLLWPIPASEILVNKSATQNPGW